MIAILFAQLQEIPWKTIGTVMLGLIGILTIGLLILSTWNQAKEAFGRKPPLNDELNTRDKALRKMIYASEANLKERVTKLEERYEEMQIDRQRKWEELQKQFGEMDKTLAFIRGKFEGDQT